MRNLIIVLSPLAFGVQLKPFIGPQNFPLIASQPSTVPQAQAPALQPKFGEEGKPRTLLAKPERDPMNPGAYEDTFPVINIRYNYPPTSIDARRRQALMIRQGEILNTSNRLSQIVMKDVTVLIRHIEFQHQIAGYLMQLPKSLKNKGQLFYLDKLAEGIPEVPASSFMEDEPQVNIGIEDNTGEFVEGPEMTTNEAIRMLQKMAKEEFEDRAILVNILRLRFKCLELMFQALIGPMRSAASDIGKLRRRGIMSFVQLAAGGQSNAATSQVKPMPVLTTLNNPNNVTHIPPTEPYRAPVDPNFSLIMALRARVMEGGREGAKALAGLIDIWNDQLGVRDSIRKSMVVVDCKLLMSMQKTPDYVKNLAGTLLTLITGIPAGSSVAEFKTGGFGHVNIVIPRPSRVYEADKEAALVSDGVS